jgi:formiminoglutamase
LPAKEETSCRGEARNLPFSDTAQQLTGHLLHRTASKVKSDPLNGHLPVADTRDPRAPSLLLDEEDHAATGGWYLTGLPYDGGIPSRPGARFGPAALRRALAGFGTFDGVRSVAPIRDLGDLDLPSMNGGEAHRRIEEAARRVFAVPALGAFIGGDHGCTGSIIRGFAEARPEARLAVISIDAHLDVREYEDTDSLSSGTPFRRALQTGVTLGDRVTMIGLRPFANSRFYLEWARSQGIHLFTVDDVAERGAGPLAEFALEHATGEADSVYLSIDLDAIDAAFAPGVSAAGIGGLTAREAITLVATLAADPRLIGFDIMELSPPYDQDDRTAKLAARLLLEALRAAGQRSEE